MKTFTFLEKLKSYLKNERGWTLWIVFIAAFLGVANLISLNNDLWISIGTSWWFYLILLTIFLIGVANHKPGQK